MSDESPCWENTNHPLPERSPFDQVLILGWYDGPEEGLIRCGRCKRVYLFKSVDFVNEDEGLRLFGLALAACGLDRQGCASTLPVHESKVAYVGAHVAIPDGSRARDSEFSH